MARRVKTTTAKAGITSANRRVLAAATTVTAPPTQSTDGYGLQQDEIALLLWRVSGTSPVFRVRVWLYSFISGAWHRGNQIVVNSSDVVTYEVNGLDRIYLQVETAPVGSAPVLDAWIALARPV